jgi:hypothetical protein
MTKSILPSDIRDLQILINSGLAWRLEGSVGRSAMAALESGDCMLPERQHIDYWGNLVPARQELVDGTKGTEGNVLRAHDERYLAALRRVGDNPHSVQFN